MFMEQNYQKNVKCQQVYMNKLVQLIQQEVRQKQLILIMHKAFSFINHIQFWTSQYKQVDYQIMKSENVMSNIEDIILINQNQSKKIKYLEKEKLNYEKYIKDLRETLNLNKMSLSHLASEKASEAILHLHQENSKLHDINNRYYEEILGFTAKLLIEEQLRNQQKKMYHEKLVEYENSMNQLRKYMQDKEDSFSAIVSRLRKYEDLNEVILESKVEKFKKEFQDDNMQVIKELSREKKQYKEILEKIRISIDDLTFLKECFENEVGYQSMKHAYKKLKLEEPSLREEEHIQSLFEKPRNSTSSSTFQSQNSKINPNKELIRLLKKQKLNNQILEEALNNAIQKNEELIEEINILVETNIAHEQDIEKLESKIVLLQHQLSNHQLIFKQKLQWKSKCDQDRPSKQWLQKFQKRGDEEEICIEGLKQDVIKISQFLIHCVPKSNLKKSLSTHNVGAKNEELEDNSVEDDIQIEEVY